MVDDPMQDARDTGLETRVAHMETREQDRVGFPRVTAVTASVQSTWRAC